MQVPLVFSRAYAAMTGQGIGVSYVYANINGCEERRGDRLREKSRRTVALAGNGPITLVNGTNGTFPSSSIYAESIMTFTYISPALSNFRSTFGVPVRDEGISNISNFLLSKSDCNFLKTVGPIKRTFIKRPRNLTLTLSK